MTKQLFNVVSAGLLAAAVFTSCGKERKIEAPEPDEETQTALDAAWATFVMTDVDMIIGFIGGEDMFPKFYMHVPGTETGSSGHVIANRDGVQKQLNINFYDAKCMDGRMRNGEIYVQYDYEDIKYNGGNPNSDYYYDYGYACKVSLNNYRVDGWQIDEYDMNYPGYIYNELTGFKEGQMRWKIAGKYTMVNPNDLTKNIMWDGVIYKTLLNADSVVNYARPNGRPVITWSNSVVSYSGSVNGAMNLTRDTTRVFDGNYGNYYTTPGTPYKMDIGVTNQLKRDFRCYPDKVAGVGLVPGPNNTFSLGLRYEEFHPFVGGIASFTIGDKYPRQIYFGNEGSDLAYQCDNVGEVLIKGIAYRVNFRK